MVANYSDPWTHQPQPRCGFVLVGRDGTISSYDYAKSIHVQTRAKPQGFDIPADELPFGRRNPIEYVLAKLESGQAIDGPLSPAIARIGQQIVDAAFRSAQEKRTVVL